MGTPQERVARLFDAVLELQSTAERAAYLDAACGQDLQLRAEVEELLAHDIDAGSFLDASGPPDPQPTTDESIGERPGTVIGPYKLMEQIGEGGMGLVFVAEQQQPIKRRVALKIIKPGMDSRQVIARFEAERQALALMDHPNIAKVHDGGTTRDGRPYFVMELVKGVPITEHCDLHCLSTRQRLQLFLDVCHAVQHAHQKGIIHRDLKPSNLLVEIHDVHPVVKVIDFGIAKAVGQQLTEKTVYTGVAQMLGTPLYMSPEQAGLSSLDVDTRSDVYSLGVLLYELLTGTTPFDSEMLRKADYDEIRRIIREDEPPRPSARLSTLQQARLSTIAERRGLEPRRLSQQLRGELDWIVMKALEKDRNRRYETANGLAMDVKRYLYDEPVLACPPSAWYRFRKVARRHKTASLAFAGIVLALTGIAASIGWAVRDRGAREEALDQTVARTLTVVIEPLLAEGKWSEALAAVNRADELLAAAGRTERPQRLVQLREELGIVERLEAIPKRKGEAKTRGASVGDPEHNLQQVALSEEYYFRGGQPDEKFAEVFRDFGIDVDALTPEEAAAAIQRRSVHPALVQALDEWAPLRRSARGENNAGWKKLVAIARLADPDPWRNRCREAFRRRDRQALEQLAKTIPIRQVTPKTLWLLAWVLKEVGALEQAVELLRRAQHEYPDDLWINDSLGNLSWYESTPPRTEDALRYFSIALSLRPTRPQLHRMVAQILESKGAFEDAVVEYSKALELDPKYTPARDNLYGVLRAQGKLDEVIAECHKAIELDPKDVRAYLNLGDALEDKGALPGAIAAYQKAIAIKPDLAKDYQLDVVPARYYICRSQWDKAAAEYAKADIWSRPLNDDTFAYACLFLIRGDYEGYNRFYQGMIQRAAQTENPWEAYVLARSCAIARKNPVDPARAVQWAKKAAADDRSPWCFHVLGLAQYRAGQFDEALQSFTKANVNAWRYWELNWFGLALVHHRLGHSDEARQCLNKGIQWLERKGPPSPQRTARLLPQDWIEAQLLRREAEELLKIKRSP